MNVGSDLELVPALRFVQYEVASQQHEVAELITLSPVSEASQVVRKSPEASPRHKYSLPLSFHERIFLKIFLDSLYQRPVALLPLLDSVIRPVSGKLP